MASRSRARVASAGGAGGAAGAGRVCRVVVAHAVAANATKRRAPVRAEQSRPLLGDFIERLDRVVEVGGVDLRGARLAGARHVDVAAGLSERHFLFLLV